MSNMRKDVCVLRVPFSARSFIHGLQAIAMQMTDKYSEVNLPVYGGSSAITTLFLARKMPDSKKIAARIQQTSETTLEASIIGNGNGDRQTMIHDLVTPLVDAYQKQYPTIRILQEYS